MADAPEITLTFDAWIDILREDVIEGEFGYEPGEFTVYAEQWRSLYRRGLTPQQAFQRALDEFSAERREREQTSAHRWAEIQVADAAAIQAHRSRQQEGA